MFSGRCFEHVADRQVAVGHSRGERVPGLVADAVFRMRGGVAGGIESRDRAIALMHHLTFAVGDEAGRGERAWMQFEAVEWRLDQRSEGWVSHAFLADRMAGAPIFFAAV